MTLDKETDPQAEPEAAQPLTPEQELEQCRKELAGEVDKRLRILADAENLKKRLVKEKEEFVKFAAESVLGDLIPVLDNLDLALLHGRSVTACKDFVMGVDMTRKIFLDILARHGLEPFGAVGEPFNPEMHEAVGSQQAPGTPEGQVLKVEMTGYRLRGRLLRPAKVVVSQA